MALQTAQLGSLPSLSTPSGGGRYVKPNPWQDLAMQALGAVLQAGVSNALERDYTKQAQAEGLSIDASAEAAPWWKKPFVGATTSEQQFGQLRGQQHATNQAALAENAATKRHREGLTTTKEEGEKTRQQQIWLEGMRQTGESGRQQAGFGHDLTMQHNTMNFTTARDAAGRAHDLVMQEGRALNEFELLNHRIAAEERMLGRKLSAEETQAVIQSFIGTAGKMVLQDDPMRRSVITQMNALGAEKGQPPMPVPPGAEQQIAELARILQSMGYNLGGAQPYAPEVPLLQR